MSNVVAIQEKEMTAPEVRDRVNLIQTVMQSVMKKDTHFGTIPFTPKPTLYKAGAEVLCMTFKIAQEYRVEDLSTPGEARYRVTCTGRHQITGMALGEGMGECSSMEEKYAYRAAVCKEEFEAAPEANKRVKWSKGKNGGAAYSTNQVKTNTADLANTILKMACKRAMVAMTLNVTAASDIFSQDLEDFPDELREFVKGDKPEAPKVTPEDIDRIKKALLFADISEDKFCNVSRIAAIEDMELSRMAGAMNWIKSQTAKAAEVIEHE